MARGYFTFRVPPEDMFPTIKDIEREKQWRYEEAVMKRILKRHRLDFLAKLLWRLPLQRGEPIGRLTFADFREKTDFPMWLATCRIEWGAEPAAIGPLENPHWSRLWWAFEEMWHDIPPEVDGLPYGLVFPIPKIKFLALHQPVSREPVQNTHLVLPNKLGSGVLILEELDALLEQIAPPANEPFLEGEERTWKT